MPPHEVRTWSSPTNSRANEVRAIVQLPSPQDHVLIRRLAATHHLSEHEKRELANALQPGSLQAAGSPIICDDGIGLVVLVSGVACTYVAQPHSSRRILALHVPGDILNLSGFLMRSLAYPVAALSQCEVARLPTLTIMELTKRYPAVQEALIRQAGVEISILRKWMEPRPTSKAIAHLYCELFIRHCAVGLACSGEMLELTLTQYDLAEAIGTSLVHTNKSARILKSKGLLDFAAGKHKILNFYGLAQHSGFSAEYLGSAEYRCMKDNVPPPVPQFQGRDSVSTAGEARQLDADHPPD